MKLPAVILTSIESGPTVVILNHIQAIVKHQGVTKIKLSGKREVAVTETLTEVEEKTPSLIKTFVEFPELESSGYIVDAKITDFSKAAFYTTNVFLENGERLRVHHNFEFFTSLVTTVNLEPVMPPA